jgi:hypothetical protein
MPVAGHLLELFQAWTPDKATHNAPSSTIPPGSTASRTESLKQP